MNNKYEEQAKQMNARTLFYALKDVKKAIEAQESDEWTRNHLDQCPYLQRLYLEKDAFVAEIQRRR